MNGIIWKYGAWAILIMAVASGPICGSAHAMSIAATGAGRACNESNASAEQKKYCGAVMMGVQNARSEGLRQCQTECTVNFNGPGWQTCRDLCTKMFQ